MIYYFEFIKLVVIGTLAGLAISVVYSCGIVSLGRMDNRPKRWFIGALAPIPFFIVFGFLGGAFCYLSRYYS